MTYPSPHPGPPQGQGGSPNSPYAPHSAHSAHAAYAAYGQQPTNAPYAGATYGQMPTPAGQASYAPPEQLAIPTQSVHQPPRAAGIPGQPYPPAQVPAPQYPAGPTASPQYQPYQPYQQEYESSGSTYLSGAATAPGYSAGSQSPLRGRPGTQTTSPQTIGTGNYVPWRGEKAAALIMMLVACALAFVVYTIFLLNFWRTGGWMNFIVTTLMFIVATPMIWWLYFGLRHLTRNQPVSEMTGLALWFGYGVLNMPTGVPSKDPYADLQNVIIVLMFVVTTVGAVLTARLNRHLRNARPWTITLALGACQFVLLNSALRFASFGISAFTALSNGRSVSQYTTNAWFIWSNSGGIGIPLAPGLLIFITITSLAAVGLFLGARSPYSKAFRIISVTTACLLALYNLFVVIAYGLPTSGEYAYSPSDTGMEMMVIIIHGAVLIGAALAAGRHARVAPPTGSGTYGSGAANVPSAQGMQSRFRQYGRPSQSPLRSEY